MNKKLVKIGPNRYCLPREGKMLVDAIVYLSSELLAIFDEPIALQQLADAACLPGLAGPPLGMPDIHQGFGLPIGGVMASDGENGVISAGAVGMDINCGVRLLASNLLAANITTRKLTSLLEAIEARIPAGVGKATKHREIKRELIERVFYEGAVEVVERGYGWPEDLEAIEEGGRLSGARPGVLSKEAWERSNQLATLGGGNHFIELGVVNEVYDPTLAEFFGLTQGRVTVMIHTGSRGLGHQICTDFTEIMVQAAPRYGIQLPTKGLAAVPIQSREGKDYFAAMACAVNFAFANRQLITHDIREAFEEVYKTDAGNLGLKVVYDIAHNIAKYELYDGKKLLVHRKGATRALPAGHPANPPSLKETGHPAIIPGSMGSSSYVVVGTAEAEETYYSVNHGAGRVLSRRAARKSISMDEFERSMGDIIYRARRPSRLLDEAPQAYKNIDQVVDTLASIGITRKVVKLAPLAVIKGEGD
ncbi:RtcB family protein [Calderihabitans maritimus]|uniref:tRNA-splicing ligase RtcB n=1 Tax=Calderihabitans maritimus TaxID=1246530 RepID=A0A1Z5HPE4_9FIRM|nr:RtcB family protein [Calderihabitans maritimus]GAW91406.1 hypothetical protein Slip_2150 [Calderihabitans maritimus]